MTETLRGTLKMQSNEAIIIVLLVVFIFVVGFFKGRGIGWRHLGSYDGW